MTHFILKYILSKITRVCVVDETGVRADRYNVDVTHSLQDDGLTLKLFLKRQTDARTKRR